MQPEPRFLLACVLASALPLAGAVEPTPPPRTNVIIMLADDLGYGDLGIQGCTDIPTPNIDSIARNGVRFTAGYVSAPVCSPSRAGLMTGRYQTRFGHEFNHPLADRSPVGLPAGEKTFATWMQDAGYVTGHIGKWHLGNPKLPQFAPRNRGFTWDVWFPGQAKLPPLTLYRDGMPEKADDRYVDAAMAREAAAFIRRHEAKPWFLYIGFLTPHEPLLTPAGADLPFTGIANQPRRKCATMVSLLDDSVGQVLRAIRESGQEQRTLVVFLSDNGAPPKNGSRNGPFRGGKGSTWEGGIREPFVMQWPGMIPGGQVIDQPVISLDLLPTSLGAAGITPPPDSALDGVDLLPRVTGRASAPPHRALFWRFGDKMAVRMGDWKLVRAEAADTHPPTLTTGLFNLAQDPGEQHDLAKAEPGRMVELQAAWDAWNAGNVAAKWTSTSHEDEAPGPLKGR